jgi:hypothetical protein
MSQFTNAAHNQSAPRPIHAPHARLHAERHGEAYACHRVARSVHFPFLIHFTFLI